MSIKIEEQEDSINIIINGATFMSVDKSRFTSREAAIKVTEDALALVQVGQVMGAATELMEFVDKLPDGAIQKDELRVRAKNHLKGKFGDAVRFES